MANEGIIFDNAFTTNPKCAPSRACVLTGMHTWQLEEACNHYSIFRNKFIVIPDLLEDSGYFCGFTRKCWTPGDWSKGGFSRNPAGNEYNSRLLIPPDKTLISSCDYAENFKEFYSKKPADKPFYFWYGGWEPHRPYKLGEGIRAGKSIDEINYIPTYLPICDEVKSDFLDYANEIEWFDKQLGKIIDHLKISGEFENTLIIVTSDNGCPFPRIKGQMYEHDFHLPMIACHKSGFKGGRRISDLVSFIDIAPTLYDISGATTPACVHGKSFADIMYSNKEGIVDNTRQSVFFLEEKSMILEGKMTLVIQSDVLELMIIYIYGILLQTDGRQEIPKPDLQIVIQVLLRIKF